MKAIIGSALLAGLAGWAGLEEARSLAERPSRDRVCDWRDDVHPVFRAIAYDPEPAVLVLEFRQGYAYRYRGVPPECAHAFLSSRAKGTFYNDRIRGLYPMERAPDRALTRGGCPQTIESQR